MTRAGRVWVAGGVATFLTAGGVWSLCRESAERAGAPVLASDKKARRYRCPMHPTFVAERPGDCPICGMRLVPTPAASAANEFVPGGDDHKPGQHDAQLAPGPTDRAVVSLTPERRRMLGLRSEPVASVALQRTIRTVGRVTSDERRLHHIHTRVEAYLERLNVDFTGKFVKRGQVLASLYSPELLATQQEYLLAWRARDRFSESGITSVRQGAFDLLGAARQRLLLWDIRPSEIERLERSGRPRRTLELRSPVSGYVLEKMAVAGMRVTPADTLFDIADLSHVWVMADVYEADLPAVQLGMDAELTLTYLPGRTWSGKVAYVAPTVDEATRTIEVRVEVGNPNGVLKPGMFADVRLKAELGRGLVAPASALLVSGARTLAFIDQGEGRIAPRELLVGSTVATGVQILGGLSEGERVVTSANFLLDSESSLKAALASLSPAAAHAH